MISFIKQNLKKIYSSVTTQLQTVFTRETIDETTLKEVEVLLITADMGVTTARTVIQNLKEQYKAGAIAHGTELKAALAQQLVPLLHKPCPEPRVIHLLIGVNGSGKTTCAGKLAHQYVKQNKKVLLVAADTFRAAATEQLEQWAQRIGCSIIKGKPQQDPASVIFQATDEFKTGAYDELIIDTAGRLQTKIPLMKELEKIKRILSKQLPDHPIETLLTVDAMLGQNSLEQAKIFHETTTIDGIVLTKMDGTGKGGIIFAISQQLNLPVVYLSHGEALEDLQPSDPETFVQQLLGI